MMFEREERLTHEAITRILKQARLRLRQREDALFNRDVLDALQEMTWLPRSELDGLAREAAGAEPGRFFSIGRQILLSGVFLFVFPGFPLMWFSLLS